MRTTLKWKEGVALPWRKLRRNPRGSSAGSYKNGEFGVFENTSKRGAPQEHEGAPGRGIHWGKD